MKKKNKTIQLFLLTILVLLTLCTFFTTAQIKDTLETSKYTKDIEKFCDEKSCTYENITKIKEVPKENYDYKEPRYSRKNSKSSIIGMVKSKEVQCREFYECGTDTKINITGCVKEYSCKTMLVYKYDTVNISSIE